MFPINQFEGIQTPFYFYDLELLERTLDAIDNASKYPGFHIHYAMKANVDLRLLEIIKSHGLGIDAVSGGEIEHAIKAGFNPCDIVYAGVGKTDQEIKFSLNAKIGCFNVESAEELERIEILAAECGKIAPIALRINPNIDAHTHHYITTGLAENKFGIDIIMLPDLIERCIISKWLKLKGLHFHIGSQITILEPYKLLCDFINKLQIEYSVKGIEFPIINVGGGLGVDYENPDENPIPDFDSFFQLFYNNLSLRPNQELHFELGRSIVAQCGTLISKVLYVKNGISKRFAILDAGFTDLIRPALYGAHHKIENISSKFSEKLYYDVVGPICESSDTFGIDELLPITSRGDLIAIRSAGAYGEIMASQYNCRPLPKKVYG